MQLQWLNVFVFRQQKIKDELLAMNFIKYKEFVKGGNKCFGEQG